MFVHVCAHNMSSVRVCEWKCVDVCVIGASVYVCCLIYYRIFVWHCAIASLVCLCIFYVLQHCVCMAVTL